jgi:hypothetical protein
MLHTEPLTGGLRTSEEPSLLEEGELVLCTNGILRPFSNYLDRLNARDQFTTGTAPAGLYTRLEGFEGGGGSGTNIGPIFQGIAGTAFSISSAIKRSGDRSLKVNPVDATSQSVQLSMGWLGDASPWGSAEAKSSVYLRFYLYIETMPSTASNIFTLLGPGLVGRLNIYLNSNGTLGFDPDGAGATGITNGTTVLTVGTWYRIELKYDDLPQQILYINGIVEVTKNVTHPGNVYHICFGLFVPSGATAYTIYIDDVCIQASSTRSLLALPGPGRIVRFELDGDGSQDGVWGSTDATAYQALDEADIDLSTYIFYATATAARQTCTMETPAAAGLTSAKAVQQSFCGYNVTTGPNVTLVQQLGAAVKELTTGFNVSVTTSYTMYGWCSSTPPSEFGILSWTDALLTALEVGVGRLTAATTQTRVSQVVFQVEYDDGLLADIWGLKATPFEQDFTDETIVLVASSDTQWFYTDNGAAWVSFRTGLTADKRIEAIHYNNQYYLANGADTQVVLKSTYATIPHGMTTLQHNSTVNPLSITPVAGVFRDVAGVYGYWITEYDSVNDLEGAAIFNGSFGSYIPGGTITTPASEAMRITINYGAAGYLTKLNPNADYWRVYRVLSANGDIEVPFPIGGERVPSYSAGSGGTRFTQVTIPITPGPTVVYDQGDLLGVAYNFVSISIDGANSLGFSIDEEPPVFSTGDIYEDCLVVNDIANDSIIRYSFPGKPHSFPSVYFLGFETKQADTVSLIRTVGDVLVVGLKGQVWRVNYLPNETDAEFARGRCKELLSANGGIPGPDCGAIFTMDDGTPRLAYVAYDGLYMTDGMRISALTYDLDWSATVNMGQLHKAVLVNNQALQCLFLYYIANGSAATAPDRLCIFSYHPLHLKEGLLKVCGISTFTTRGADYAFSTRKSYAADATTVYTEDEGTPLTLTVSTRIIYPENIDDEFTVQRVWTLFKSATHTASTIALKRRFANAVDVTDTSLAISGATPLVKKELHGRAEGFGALLSADEALKYIAFEFTGTKGK